MEPIAAHITANIKSEEKKKIVKTWREQTSIFKKHCCLLRIHLEWHFLIAHVTQKKISVKTPLSRNFKLKLTSYFLANMKVMHINSKFRSI